MSPAQARNAVIAVFALNGLMIASWFSRLPQLRDQIGLTPGELGRVLLVGAIGTIFALPVAGLLVNRLGPRTAVVGAAALSGLGTVLLGLAAEPLASAVAASAGLFVAGYGAATWDVSMNVEGAAVERQLRRTLMPRLHAGFSVGTVVGAGAGALAEATEVPVSWHFGVVGLVTAAGALFAARFFVAGRDQPAVRSRSARSGLWAAWREPRTLLIGVLLLSCALSEGIANDWLAIGLVDGYQVSNAVGSIGFAIFVAAMTVCRIWGTAAVDRFGRVRVLRVSAAMAVAGVLLVVFGGVLPVALAGAVLWGAGAALGFPLGMSAATDDPARAAVRVSVVSSIGYTAFLAGPPLLGWLGDQVGVQRALLFVLAAVVVGAVVASATSRRGAPEPGTVAMVRAAEGR